MERESKNRTHVKNKHDGSIDNFENPFERVIVVTDDGSKPGGVFVFGDCVPVGELTTFVVAANFVPFIGDVCVPPRIKDV